MNFAGGSVRPPNVPFRIDGGEAIPCEDPAPKVSLLHKVKMAAAGPIPAPSLVHEAA